MQNKSTVVLYSGNEVSIMPKIVEGILEKYIVSIHALSLDDITMSLGRICRFTGSLHITWSVLEHSLLVYKIALGEKVNHKIALGALLHDVSEIVIGDISSPIKAILGDSVLKLGEAVDKELYRFWGLPELTEDEKSLIKRYDTLALSVEARIFGCARLQHYFVDHVLVIEELALNILKLGGTQKKNNPISVDFAFIFNRLLKLDGKIKI